MQSYGEFNSHFYDTCETDCLAGWGIVKYAVGNDNIPDCLRGVKKV